MKNLNLLLFSSLLFSSLLFSSGPAYSETLCQILARELQAPEAVIQNDNEVLTFEVPNFPPISILRKSTPGRETPTYVQYRVRSSAGDSIQERQVEVEYPPSLGRRALHFYGDTSFDLQSIQRATGVTVHEGGSTETGPQLLGMLNFEGATTGMVLILNDGKIRLLPVSILRISDEQFLLEYSPKNRTAISLNLRPQRNGEDGRTTGRTTGPSDQENEVPLGYIRRGSILVIPPNRAVQRRGQFHSEIRRTLQSRGDNTVNRISDADQ